MDPELYDIEFEKLSDKYNINNQLLNIKLKDKKLDNKFIEENTDLITKSIFITPTIPGFWSWEFTIEIKKKSWNWYPLSKIKKIQRRL